MLLSAGFVTYTENNEEKAVFICNDDILNPELFQYCSENIIRNTLTCNLKTIAEQMQENTSSGQQK